MKPSRIAAVALVLGGGAWIGSGVLGRDAVKEASLQSKSPVAAPLFKVAVLPTQQQMHQRRITLSGRTEADRKVWAVARVSGVILDLKGRRGSLVKAGDVIADVITDAVEETLRVRRAVLWGGAGDVSS